MQSSSLIDSHCHLDFDVFTHQLPALLDQAHTLNITRFIVPGVYASQWERLLTLHHSFPQCLYAFGLHPYFLTHYTSQDLTILMRFIEQYSPIAIGEIGLDFLHDTFQPTDQALQMTLLEAQLSIARQAQLPVILHARKTYDTLLKYIRRVRFDQGGVIHAFNGSLQQAQQFIDQGFCLGIGGSITYPRGHKLKSTLSQLPLSAIVLETDAPDMPLCGFQGQPNTPLRLPMIAQTLADHLSLPVDTVIEYTTHNTNRIFKLS